MKKKNKQIKNIISIILLVIFIIAGRYIGIYETPNTENIETSASINNQDDGIASLNAKNQASNNIYEANTNDVDSSATNNDNSSVLNNGSGNTISADNVDFNNDKLNVMFFYVGQADSSFIKLGDKSILIDAGNNGDGSNVSSFLKKKGITKIDYLIGTHCDEDHIGGLDEIIDNLDIGQILMPSKGSNTANYKNVIKSAEKKNLTITNPNIGDEFKINDLDMKILSVENKDNYSDNNSSIVSKITYVNNKFLFMGDAEKEIENMYKWDKVDVLKVGHHGSNTSSTANFLSQVRPTYSVIEVGKNNSYRLPNKYTIKRLEDIGTTILRTDTNESSFLMTSDGNTINVSEVNLNLDSESNK